MTDDFLTKGLQNDRYLKAIRLSEQFEAEMESRLRQVGQQIIAENGDFFNRGVEGRKNVGTSSSSVLAFARIDYPMNRVQSLENQTSTTLNVHLYWCRPTQYNRTDIDGALRAFGYKIKNASDADNEHVAAKTRDWSLQVAEDPFGSGSRKVFYKHVNSADDIDQVAAKIAEHFSQYGSVFGVAPDN